LVHSTHDHSMKIKIINYLIFQHTAPLFDALFSLLSSASTASGPSFVFNDIENTAIVRHRKKVVDSSSYILVDANQEGDEAPSPKLPVPAVPGDCIEVDFISSIDADSILGLEIGADMQAGTKSQLAGFTIVSIWDVHNEASSFSETIQSSKRFAKCRNKKPGDTVVELNPISVTR
jgi:hypothetical protein